jgi:hypothetical protein
MPFSVIMILFLSTGMSPHIFWPLWNPTNLKGVSAAHEHLTAFCIQKLYRCRIGEDE